MARQSVDLSVIGGFVEEIKKADGTTVPVPYKPQFGGILEEYYRTNQWVEFTNTTFGEDHIYAYKTNFSEIRTSYQDFDASTKRTGATTVPRLVEIRATETKEFAATWFQEDWIKSNGLQNIGNMIIDKLILAGDSFVDKVFYDQWVAAANANTSVPAVEVDTSAAITFENGKLLYEKILTLLMDLRASGDTNDYVEGKVIKGENIQIAISPRAEEMLLAYKKEWQTEVGLLSTGNWGGYFRNTKVVVIDEWEGLTSTDEYHVIIATKRAISGTIIPAFLATFIPAEINQTSWMDQFNYVMKVGTGIVFENEVTGIKGTTTTVPESKTTTLKPTKKNIK